MSRPTLDLISREDPDWLTKLNANLVLLFDGPLPVCDNPTAFNAKKYEDCFGVLSGVLYKSDGTSWINSQLTNIPDLNPTTAILSDIVTAYNTLLADMQAKGLML